MFRLHHADSLDPLLDALADVLSAPLDDPFTPDVVVVPAAGLRDAAMVGLGRRLGATGLGDGIAANVEFLFPGRFLARAMGEASPIDGPEADPWRLPRLAWAVLEELATGAVDVPGSQLEQRWALARRVADLFDRYATQRPRLVRQWADGVDGDGTVREDGTPNLLPDTHRWQPALWRAVRARIDRPSPPERLPGLLLDISAGRLRPLLPSRFAVFGVGALAPTLTDTLRALSAAGFEVHAFLRHPSAAAWHSSPFRLEMALNTRAALDVTTAVANPLLSSWGRPSLEARALLRGLPDVTEVADGDAPPTAAATLLAAVQRSVRLDQPATPQAVDAHDGSLQVHACHGVVRQLEVLRDALGHAFADDPTLQPHDVLVLCPQVDRFAPMVEAVFGRGDFPVPVRVGDRSLAADEPVIEAVQRVLALVAGRATLSEVLSLVQFEPVRRRFGWSVEQVEQFAGWCDELGARWGLTAEHRVPWGLPSQVANGTWRSVVDQLLAGAAMAAPTPRLVLGDIAPYDDIGTGEFELVGTIADLLARLLELHAQVQGQHPVAHWVALLHDVVDGFTAPDPAEPWRHQEVHRDLSDIVVAARPAPDAAPSAVPLSLADVRSLLGDAVAARPGRLPLRSGAVTVSSMVPQHGVPARVVCLLGLDDGSLRGGTFDGDDVLGLRPCLGERHPRHESRQLLLDAVLAARDRLIVTCDGADLTTNKRVPLVVPLQELLDVAGPIAGVPSDRLVVRHPRHGFGEAALRPGGLVPGSAQSFTFDRSMLAAAEALREAGTTDPVRTRSPWALPPVPLPTVSVDELVDAVTNPSRVYLQQRLDVSIPSEPSAIEDGLAVELTPLGLSNVGRDLMGVRRRGGAADEWEVVARLDGAMPPGELSTLALREVRDEVGLLEALAVAWSLPLEAADELRIHLDLRVPLGGADAQPGVPTEIVVQGDVRGLVLDGGAGCVADIRFGRPKPSMRLALAIRLAALELAHPDREWRAALLTRNDSSSKVEPMGVGLRLRGDATARSEGAHALLAMAVQLLHWARRDAVPFFDKTSEKLHRGDIGAVYSDLERAMFRDRFEEALWPDLQADVLLDEPVLTDDPWFLPRGLSRAAAAAGFVWGTFDACVEVLDAEGNPVAAEGGDDE